MTVRRKKASAFVENLMSHAPHAIQNC